jgi:restriction system protein
MTKRYRPVKYSRNQILAGLIFFGALFLSAAFVSSEELFTRSYFLLGLGMLLIFGVINIFSLFKAYRELRLKKALRVTNIDRMAGIEFEKYIGALLKFKGYKNVSFTPQSGDFGVDVLAEKDRKKYAVQVKRYTNLVNIDAVYQALGGKEYYHCDAPMVITNSFFTPAAKKLAVKTKVRLIDRKELLQWMVEFQKS